MKSLVIVGGLAVAGLFVMWGITALSRIAEFQRRVNAW